MKLLRVIYSLRREAGGPVAGLAETSPVLAEAGIASEFVVLDGCRPEQIPFSTFPVHVFRGRGFYGSCGDLKNWLDRNIQNYDAVFVHGCWQFHGVAVRAAALKHDIPYFVYPHGMLDPWFNKRYPLKWLKKQIYWWLREYAVHRDAQSVLFTSEEEMRLAAEAFFPYRSSGQVVPYGTRAPDPTSLDSGVIFRKRHDFLPDAPYVLCLGRIHEKKGIDLLIDAWKQWKASAGENAMTWQLIIAGPEGEVSYESLILKKMNSCSDIHRVDSLFDKTKWSALSGALALILPSHQENFGMVVAEALSAGTPVLLTKQVNTWSEVTKSKAGAAEDDTHEGIIRLLGSLERTIQSSSATAVMRENAHACYMQYFCIDQLCHTFHEILNPRKK
jgi:glycosyltransferase involved in cell wall biosynthesis